MAFLYIEVPSKKQINIYSYLCFTTSLACLCCFCCLLRVEFHSEDEKKTIFLSSLFLLAAYGRRSGIYIPIYTLQLFFGKKER